MPQPKAKAGERGIFRFTYASAAGRISPVPPLHAAGTESAETESGSGLPVYRREPGHHAEPDSDFAACGDKPISLSAVVQAHSRNQPARVSAGAAGRKVSPGAAWRWQRDRGDL